MENTEQKQYNVIIDDCPMTPMILSKIMGMESLHYESLEMFKDNCSSLYPNAFFIDINLKNKESGLTVIPFIKKEWPKIPIIVISTTPEAECIREALSCGADDFVEKPFNAEVLKARMELRREQKDSLHPNFLEFNDIYLDTFNKEIKGNTGNAHITDLDVKLLEKMILQKHKVLSHEELKQCWNLRYVSDSAFYKKMHEIKNIVKSVSNKSLVKNMYKQGFKII